MSIKIEGSKGTEYTYNQDDIIGSGYYACVYKAYDKSKNLVAIKVVNNIPIKKRRKGSINGSEKEVNILQRLNPTPYALSLVDIAKDKRYVYIITEYCEGGTLRNILASSKNGFLDEKTAIRYLYEIAKGLATLHSHGIMHRDLNLDNILLRKGCCVIGDFGSATTNINSDTTCVGTPEYRAPEIFLANSKRTYNKQADLWSLGVIFHEMLFGKKPYEGESIQEIERKVLGGEYKIPDTNKKISKESKDLLRRLLLSNPPKRITLQQIFGHQIFDNFQINSLQDQQEPSSFNVNHNKIQITTKKFTFLEKVIFPIIFVLFLLSFLVILN